MAKVQFSGNEFYKSAGSTGSTPNTQSTQMTSNVQQSNIESECTEQYDLSNSLDLMANVSQTSNIKKTSAGNSNSAVSTTSSASTSTTPTTKSTTSSVSTSTTPPTKSTTSSASPSTTPPTKSNDFKSLLDSFARFINDNKMNLENIVKSGNYTYTSKDGSFTINIKMAPNGDGGYDITANGDYKGTDWSAEGSVSKTTGFLGIPTGAKGSGTITYGGQTDEVDIEITPTRTTITPHKGGKGSQKK